jgi:hypothetical protein
MPTEPDISAKLAIFFGLAMHIFSIISIITTETNEKAHLPNGGRTTGIQSSEASNNTFPITYPLLQGYKKNYSSSRRIIFLP